MSFRFKLLISITLLVSLSCVCAGTILYYQAQESVFRQLQSKVLSVATSTAALVDGEKLKQIRTREDEESQEYQDLVQQLRRVRDVNRRTDIHVAYIYTMMYDPENPGVIRFGVDAEEDPAERSDVGDVYEGKPGHPLAFAADQVDSTFSVDRWGTWLSANAPVKDGAGSVVGLLGVDVSAADVLYQLAVIRWSLFVAVGVSFLLALGLAYGLSRRVSRPLLKLRSTLEQIGKGDLEARIHLKTRDEFGEVATAVNRMAVGLKEREELKNAFARYVSQQVMDEILSHGGDLSLRGTRKKVTVLFSDIRNFTTLAEGHTPEQVVGFLNEYFERMIDVIFKNKGTLDKFIGDGMMVLFGAPLSDDEQEKNAVHAALGMQLELSRLTEKWRETMDSDIRIGIGIHTGQAIVGNIGSDKRMEYTAIGDTVNVASRLESSTKALHTPILVSESTRDAVCDQFTFRDEGSIEVKGRSAPVRVYSLEEAQ